MLLFIGILMIRCGRQTENIQSDNGVFLEYKEIQNETSKISVPILYKIQNLENMINSKIRGTIYNDNSFKNNGNDKLKLKIEKNGTIKIDALGNVLSYSVPLKVRIEKKLIGTKKVFGKNIFQKGNVVEFALVLFFDSNVDINNDWKLLTKTQYKGLKWETEPTATVLKINIAGLVEKELDKKMGDLTNKIDKSLHDNLDIKKQIEKVWKDIQKPFLINKKAEKIWLQFSPYSIQSTVINTKGKNIFIQIQLETFAQTLIGASPPYSINDSIPSLLKLANSPDQFDLNIVCKLPYTSINNILKKFVAGKEINVEGINLKINSAHIQGNSSNLLFKLEISGDVKGSVTFKGKPRFNTESKSIEIDKFDFDLESEEWLLTAANQVLHDEIKNQIKQKLSIPLEEYMQKIPLLINSGIEKGKLKEKINIYVDSLQLDLKKTEITQKDFQFLINGKGRVLLELEKL